MLNDLAKAMKALDGKSFFLLCFFVCFALLLFCLAFLSCSVTAQWIVYRSNSVLFCMHIVDRTDVATDLIR